MKVGLLLCFREGFSKPGFYGEIFKKLVRFTPSNIIYGTKDRRWKASDFSLMEKYTGEKDIVISDENDNSFLVTLSAAMHSHRSITIVQDHHVFLPGSKEIEKYIDNDDFVTGYLYNEDFEFVQSTKYANALKERDIAPEIMASIKNTPTRQGLFNLEYDTKYNPGRSELINYTWLMVSWKMWFGKPFFDLLPKEKLLSYPHATTITELANGQVFVQLYDDVDQPYTPENIYRQWKWREWMNYDELVERES